MVYIGTLDAECIIFLVSILKFESSNSSLEFRNPSFQLNSFGLKISKYLLIYFLVRFQLYLSKLMQLVGCSNSNNNSILATSDA